MDRKYFIDMLQLYAIAQRVPTHIKADNDGIVTFYADLDESDISKQVSQFAAAVMPFSYSIENTHGKTTHPTRNCEKCYHFTNDYNCGESSTNHCSNEAEGCFLPFEDWMLELIAFCCPSYKGDH